jgi:hypothetical protein
VTDKRATGVFWVFLALAAFVGGAEIYLFLTDPNGTQTIWLIILPTVWSLTFVVGMVVLRKRCWWMLLTAPFGLWGWIAGGMVTLGCIVSIQHCV